MKKILLLVFIILLISCNKNIYNKKYHPYEVISTNSNYYSMSRNNLLDLLIPSSDTSNNEAYSDFISILRYINNNDLLISKGKTNSKIYIIEQKIQKIQSIKNNKISYENINYYIYFIDDELKNYKIILPYKSNKSMIELLNLCSVKENDIIRNPYDFIKNNIFSEN